MNRTRNDPIFPLKTPLLFAHRGGAGEVPESTEHAFRHAVCHGTDVLEIDVGLTADAEMVVWHGPGLKNVRREDDKNYKGSDRIGRFEWKELQDKAWVCPPASAPELRFEATPERALMTLEKFFNLVEKLDKEAAAGNSLRKLHVNIELKKHSGRAPEWNTKTVSRLFELLNAQPEHRKLILASVDRPILEMLRKQINGRGGYYPTNLSLGEQLAYSQYMKRGPIKYLATFADVIARKKETLINCAFQTSHAVLHPRLVHEVRKLDGSVYVFLTGLPMVPGIDERKSEELQGRLFELLDAGVDGIMTDYPKKVGLLLEKWKKRLAITSCTTPRSSP